MALNLVVTEDCEVAQFGSNCIISSRLSKSQANVASNTLLPGDPYSQTNDGSVSMVVQDLPAAIRGRSFEHFNANGQIFQHVAPGDDQICMGQRVGKHIASAQMYALAGLYCHKDGLWSVRFVQGDVSIG